MLNAVCLILHFYLQFNIQHLKQKNYANQTTKKRRR